MLLLSLTRLALGATCTPLVDDDLTDGGSDGDAWGGSFTASGWVSGGGSIVYNLPAAAPAGRFELVVTGLEEAGVSQSDLAEMFTSHYGSFTDSAVDQFLQLKFAGDIYDGYDGRIKLQLGMEYGVSGTEELAMWSGERNWHPADRHTLTAVWGGGYSTLAVDGAVVAAVDYTPEAGGIIYFTSLRIPNNGSYTYDPLMSGLTFESVWLCGEIDDPPTISAYDVTPREVAQGDTLTLSWAVDGGVSSALVCGEAQGTGEVVCTPELGASSGTYALSSGQLAVGAWSTWLEVDGGAAVSAPVDLVVHEPGWTAGGDPGGGDSGAADGAGDGGGPGGDAGGNSGNPPPIIEKHSAGLGRPGAPAGGCGCGGGSAGAGWLAAALLAARRRR